MKKKIALILSILSVVLMLGACGTTDSTTVDYNGVSYDELLETTENMATKLKGHSVEALMVQKEGLKLIAGEEAAFTIDLIDKWVAAMQVSGDFVKIKEDSFSVAKSGKTLTTDLVLEFEDRDVSFQLVYSYHDMKMTGVTIEPVYSLDERMLKAGLNTIICMSMVFVVLIFISLIISCFMLFSLLDAKKKGKKLAAPAAPPVAKAPVEEVQNQDDTELVAVIAAAIAAYEGTSTNDFVVRSIRRR